MKLMQHIIHWWVSGYRKVGWDGALLVLMWVGILGHLAYLFWPQPVATFYFEPIEATVSSISKDSRTFTSSLKTTLEPISSEKKTKSTSSAAWIPLTQQGLVNLGNDTEVSILRKTKRPPSLRSQEDSSGKAPLVRLNKADTFELQRLPGIGPKRAKQIIEFREALGGSFSSVEQLTQVKGIGPKSVAKIKPLVTLSSPSP